MFRVCAKQQTTYVHIAASKFTHKHTHTHTLKHTQTDRQPQTDETDTHFRPFKADVRIQKMEEKIQPQHTHRCERVSRLFARLLAGRAGPGRHASTAGVTVFRSAFDRVVQIVNKYRHIARSSSGTRTKQFARGWWLSVCDCGVAHRVASEIATTTGVDVICSTTPHSSSGPRSTGRRLSFAQVCTTADC